MFSLGLWLPGRGLPTLCALAVVCVCAGAPKGLEVA